MWKTDSPATKSPSINQPHYVPHKRELMVLVRTDNSRMKSTTKNVPLYNQKRYKLRVAEDLETISVPLTASSMTLIERVRASATLVSNPALVHVTLVEGLRAAMPIRSYKSFPTR